MPNVRPEKDASGLVPEEQETPYSDSSDEGSSLNAVDGIRVERDEMPDGLAEEVLLVDADESIRVARAESQDSAVEGVLPLEAGEKIRVEKRSRPYRLPLPGSDDEFPEEAEKNGYIVSLPTEDSDRLVAAVNDEEVRPMRRDNPSRTIPREAKWYKIPIPEADEKTQLGQQVRPERRNSPSHPARTPSPRIPSWHKIPIVEGDTTYKVPAPEVEESQQLDLPKPDTETIRVERRGEEEGPANPLITPAPELPVSTDEEEVDAENGIRVEKRAAWTTPDFLTSFFPLFITLACSCLISSAAPMVTSSVTEVRQTWNYTTVRFSFFFSAFLKRELGERLG